MYILRYHLYLYIKNQLVLFTILLASAVQAQERTITIEFTASNFFSPLQPTLSAPVDPVSGSITLTYDPSIDVTSGTLDSIDLTIDNFVYCRMPGI